MPASETRPPALTTLQAGRGLAALLVVLFHATGLIASKSYWSADVLHGFFDFGHAGVEFFFALSGFIMVLIHRDDIGKPHRIYNFLIKRVTRIYPIYWLVTMIVFIFYLSSGNERTGLYKNSILLIGYDNYAILAVAWTLFHEVLFYCIFAIVIFNRKIGLFSFIFWFAICSLWLVKPAPQYGVSSINIIFGFGMLSALVYKHLANPLVILSVAIGAFLALGVEEVYLHLLNDEVRTLLYGAASAIGIAAVVCAEKNGSISSPRFMTALGDSSYSLYLVHYPVLAVVGRLWLATSLRSLPVSVAFCFLIAAAVISGFSTHWLIEKRLIAIFGKRRA